MRVTQRLGGADMRIKLGAQVRTKDGHKAGQVKKVIWDPASNEVNAFVVSTGGLLGHDVVVSRDTLERAGRDGDELVLDLTKDELHQFEQYEAGDYAPPPVGWAAPVPYDYPAAAFILTTEPMPSPIPMPAASHDDHDHTGPAIAKGMHVKDAGGESLGIVDEVRVDEATGELRSVIVRKAGVFGGGAVREIPADHLEVAERELHVIEEAPGTHVR
jgi:sporulation protein YlmC with PRC-barrel domain